MPQWVSIIMAVFATIGVGSIIREVLVRKWSSRDKAITENANVEIAGIASADRMNDTLWAQIQRTQGTVAAVQAQIFAVTTENGALKFRVKALEGNVKSLEGDNSTCREELAAIKESMERIHSRSAPPEVES